jgi:hypothetical protein
MMMTTRTALVGLGCLAQLACGGRQGLHLNLIDHSVQRPSNVAVYFTVDTADGEPVPGLTVEQFRIYENGQLISEFESKETILNPEIAAVHNTLLLVDMSGSVTESGDVFRIVDAASRFAERVGRLQQVGVYAFDGRREIVPVQGFSGNPGQVLAGIKRLESFPTRDPSTNLNGAVVLGLRELDRQLARARVPLRFGTLVVFTDGSDRAHRVTREELLEALDASEHDILVVGVGAEIDERELNQIGRSGAILSKDGDEVASAFEEAAARIEAFTRRYYLLGYCSPARAGVHEVTIEAEFEGKTGTLHYEFDATGFGPNCDPTRPPRFDVRRPRSRPR